MNVSRYVCHKIVRIYDKQGRLNRHHDDTFSSRTYIHELANHL